MQKSATNNTKALNVKFVLGFSELQINQVTNNCDKLFTIDDVLNYIEIWDMKHAHKIMSIMIWYI